MGISRRGGLRIGVLCGVVVGISRGGVVIAKHLIASILPRILPVGVVERPRFIRLFRGGSRLRLYGLCRGGWRLDGGRLQQPRTTLVLDHETANQPQWRCVLRDDRWLNHCGFHIQRSAHVIYCCVSSVTLLWYVQTATPPFGAKGSLERTPATNVYTVPSSVLGSFGKNIQRP